jgi:ADP-dependent NAD(P)H-hydrate dehydratase / NAD(P)H-hydrate epimerase
MPFYSTKELRTLKPAPKLLLSEQARAFEVQAQATLAPHTLMSRAGDAVARLTLANYPHAEHITVLCGPGNNGGDGFVAAAWLLARGVRVSVFCDLSHAQYSPDATWAREKCHAPMHELHSPKLIETLRETDVVIDALFGAGLNKPLAEPWLSLIKNIRATAKPIVAVDMPSGLHGDTGIALGTALRADVTLALLSLRPGHFTGEAAAFVGELWWHDLDILPAGAAEYVHITSASNIILPAVSNIHHKGSRGTLAVIGGAKGMRGAPLLGARTALMCGAGRVHVGFISAPDEAAPELDAQEPSLMCHTLTSTALSFDADTIVFGPGAGASELAKAFLHDLLSSKKPLKLVIDADGLNLLAQHAELATLLQARDQNAPLPVLTPHPLEAARLLGCSVNEVQSNRLAAARKLATLYHSIVILKGAGSVIASPSGQLAINSSGSARLATAGSGDVLAGLIGALLAQSLSPWNAVYSAVYIHGCGGDMPANGTILPIVASKQSEAIAAVMQTLSAN